MEILVGGRKSGKTTTLIQRCAEAEARGEASYIACHSHEAAYRIAQKAREMGYESFPFPITYDELLIGQYSYHNIRNIYIDNVDMLLGYICQVNIPLVTFNSEQRLRVAEETPTS